MEVGAAVVGVLEDNLCACSYRCFSINAGRIVIFSRNRTGIVVNNLANILGDGLGCFLVDVAVGGITKFVGQDLITYVDGGRETIEVLGFIGARPEVKSIENPTDGDLYDVGPRG